MQEWAVELAEILFESGAVAFGEFTLTSGIRSPIYVDLRRLPSYPTHFRRVIAMLGELADSIRESYDCIVGVATAGIVWGAVLAYVKSKPFAYVRGKRKEHGLGRLVEGGVEGCRALLVDDVATTGSSLASAAKAVIEEGGRPVAALVILDREQGARENLAPMGVKLYAVATLREVLTAAAEKGLVEREVVSKVLSSLYGGEAR
jgi:orotate phosphoribosyltransferase